MREFLHSLACWVIHIYGRSEVEPSNSVFWYSLGLGSSSSISEINILLDCSVELYKYE